MLIKVVSNQTGQRDREQKRQRVRMNKHEQQCENRLRAYVKNLPQFSEEFNTILLAQVDKIKEISVKEKFENGPIDD